MELSMKVFRSRTPVLPNGWAIADDVVARARPSRTDLVVQKSEEIRSLLEERLVLREQLENIRELAERLMLKNDEKHEQVLRLEAALREKDTLVADLEQENADLIRQISVREDRIAALKSFLERIAGPEPKPASR